MFFLLSKTLYYLTMPFTIIVILLLLAAFWKKPEWKKRFFIGAIVLLLFFSNEFIANEMMRAWEIDAVPYSEIRKHKLAIVLTGATLPLEYPNDRIYFQRGADRIVHTVQLYKLGIIEKILVSGGTGSLVGARRAEADEFKMAMMLMGVPDSVIMIENKTRNTYESAVAVKKLLDDLGYEGKDCLLVTSAFHMRRSLACYNKQEIYPDAFTCDFFAHGRDYYFDTLFIPQMDAMNLWHKAIKEWTGIVAYWLAGYV